MAAPPVQPMAPPQKIEPPRDNLTSKTALYVGDLDPGVTEAELHETFSRIGHLASVCLCRDSLSSKSLCYAYVNFISSADAAKALACLNHTNLNGKSMRIMWFHRDPHPRKTGVANLYVKNLDPSITSARLEGMFCQFGHILSCKVAQENGMSRGFGFVQFETEESAIAAVKGLHDVMIEGKKLYVSKFVKKDAGEAAHDEPTFTNLYVKNFDENLTEDSLLNKFSKYGKVCSVVIMKDTEGKSKGFGFVNFESAEEAKMAVEALNGALVGSKNLFVGRAQKKAEREKLLKSEANMVSNLYVKNLDASIDDKMLHDHFSAYGHITSAKVMRSSHGKSRGFGFVCFSNLEEAKAALSSANGTLFKGKYLYVAVAQRKEHRLKDLERYFSLLPDALSLPLCSANYYIAPAPALNPVSHINPCQPAIYLYYDNNTDVYYSIPTQSYQQNFSTYIPNTRNWAYPQHSSMATYTSLNVRCGQSRRTWNKGLASNGSVPQKVGLTWNKGPASNGSAPQKVGFVRKVFPGSSKKIIGEVLQPLVENLQPEYASKITGMLLEMKNPDLLKLLKSPDTLAVQVNKAVQVLKEANGWTNSDGAASMAVSSC